MPKRIPLYGCGIRVTLANQEELSVSKPDVHPYEIELETAVTVAAAAASVVRDLYDRVAAETYTKSDGSPVTDADLAADRMIRERLSERFPDDAILSEESADDPRRLTAPRCWIVDPLDGTAQFVARTGDFDVLIALVVGGRPVVAVGCQPTTGLLCGAVSGRGAWTATSVEADRTPLQFLPPARPPRITTSIWFGAPLNASLMGNVADRLGAAPPPVAETGFSPRIFLPVDGRRQLDAMLGIHPRHDKAQEMGREWDFVVADLIINEAGGVVTDLTDQLHAYNKPSTRNRGGLLAAVDRKTHRQVLQAVADVRKSSN